MSDKQYEVIKATTRPLEVEISGKRMPFDSKYNAFRVKDPGVAEAIRQKYDRDVTVTAIPTVSRMEKQLHPNRIVSPGMPWHKYDELGRIIREEKENALQDSERNQRQQRNIQLDRDQKQ